MKFLRVDNSCLKLAELSQVDQLTMEEFTSLIHSQTHSMIVHKEDQFLSLVFCRHLHSAAMISHQMHRPSTFQSPTSINLKRRHCPPSTIHSTSHFSHPSTIKVLASVNLRLIYNFPALMQIQVNHHDEASRVPHRMELIFHDRTWMRLRRRSTLQMVH